MPTKEEHLAKYTYKEDGLEVEKRIFYTLIGEDNAPLTPEKLRAYRNSKAIAQLFKVLVENGTVSDDQLDDILLEVAL
jgi:hypothetical protein